MTRYPRARDMTSWAGQPLPAQPKQHSSPADPPYSRWAPKTLHSMPSGALHGYSVSYSANGGTGSVPSDSNTYVMGGTPVVLFDSLPTRTGYTFKGWATSDSASEATFRLRRIRHAHDGHRGCNAVCRMVAEPLFDLVYVERQPRLPARITARTRQAIPCSAIRSTLRSRHARAIHSIIGIRWVPSSRVPRKTGRSQRTGRRTPIQSPTISMAVQTTIITPKRTPLAAARSFLAPATRPGYTFLGWYVGSTPNSTIAAGSTGNKTFTAKWSTAIRYGITYTMNGGINYPFNPSYYTVNSATIHLQDPWRTGYDFAGWTPTNTIPQGSSGSKSIHRNLDANHL